MKLKKAKAKTCFKLAALSCMVAAAQLQAHVIKKPKDCQANQTNMNLCAAVDFKQLDLKLHDMVTGLAEAQASESQRESLINAHVFWFQYRDAHCSFEAGDKLTSGSIWPLNYYACTTRMTHEQIKNLHSLLPKPKSN